MCSFWYQQIVVTAIWRQNWILWIVYMCGYHVEYTSRLTICSWTEGMSQLIDIPCIYCRFLSIYMMDYTKALPSDDSANSMWWRKEKQKKKTNNNCKMYMTICCGVMWCDSSLSCIQQYNPSWTLDALTHALWVSEGISYYCFAFHYHPFEMGIKIHIKTIHCTVPCTCCFHLKCTHQVKNSTTTTTTITIGARET